MALVTNRRNAAAYARGTITGGAESWDTRRISSLVNIYASEASVDDKSGIPNGQNTGAILLPLKPGGMSVYQQAAAISATSADAKLGQPMVASSTMTLTVTNAQGDQIVALVASGTLAITVTDAALTAGVEAVASGTMTMTGDASLGGIIPVTASGTCSMVGDVDMTALANMEAEAGGPTPLSPEGLAIAVWSEDLTDYGTSNTAGKVLKQTKQAASNAFAVSS